MTKCKQKYPVICSEIDVNSQMKAIAVPVYFQDCFIRYAAKNYFATFDLETKDIYWFITDYDINFSENLPFWSEDFYTEVWISKISKLKVIVDFIFTWRDEVFAKGTSTWILFDKKNNKPLLTDVLFSDYSETEFSINNNKKILWDNECLPIKTVEHYANLTDVDFNEHVNNCSYVNLAITTASDKIQQQFFIKRLAVRFLKQSYLNNKLICTSFATNTENEYITNIKVNENDVCKIYTLWERKSCSHNILDCDLNIRK